MKISTEILRKAFELGLISIHWIEQMDDVNEEVGSIQFGELPPLCALFTLSFHILEGHEKKVGCARSIKLNRRE